MVHQSAKINCFNSDIYGHSTNFYAPTEVHKSPKMMMEFIYYSFKVKGMIIFQGWSKKTAFCYKTFHCANRLKLTIDTYVI